jgi:cation:H+ antiporter
MLIAVFGVVFGLALLTLAADQFVVGATRVAAALRLSAIVIGAVVIGFGTSLPEIVVSGLAAGAGRMDLAVGNIIGSNVANLALVLGAAALVAPIAVRSRTLKREAPLSLAAVVLFAVLLQGGLGVLEGVLLAAALIAFLTIVYLGARGGDPELEGEVAEFLTSALPPLRVEVTRTVVSLILVLVASQALILSATTIAEEFGIDEGFVGLTIVAIGTSLPELATALQAARRREADLVVGNLLGSNVFNATAVGAMIAFVGPHDPVSPALAGPATIVMVVVALIALVFKVTGARVARTEGIVLLIGYLAVLPFLATG